MYDYRVRGYIITKELVFANVVIVHLYNQKPTNSKLWYFLVTLLTFVK